MLENDILHVVLEGKEPESFFFLIKEKVNQYDKCNKKLWELNISSFKAYKEILMLNWTL